VHKKITENIRDNVSLLIGRYVSLNFIRANIAKLSGTVFFSAIIIVILIMIEMSYRFGTSARRILFFAGTAAVLIIFIRYLIFFFRSYKKHRLSKRETVSEIDSAYPDLNLLMMHDLSIKKENSALYDIAFNDLAQRFNEKREKPVFFSYRQTYLSWFRLAAAGLTAAAILNINSAISAGERLINFSRDYSVPPSHFLKLISKDILTAEMDSIELVCRSDGDVPGIIRLKKRYVNSDVFISREVMPADPGLFRIRTAENTSFYYYFESSETVSDTGFVSVIRRPDISSMSVKVISPDYTRIPEKEYNEIISKISLYKGSKVKFNIKTTVNELDSAFIEFTDGKRKELIRNSDGSYFNEISFLSDSEFTFRLYSSERGIVLKNFDPVVQKAEIIKDEFPVVNFILPEDGYLIDQSLNVPVLAAAADDFELSSAFVNYRKISFLEFAGKTERSGYAKIRIPVKENSDGVYAINTSFSCADLNLLPEDKVEVFIRVFDNDGVSGPKFTDSEIRTVMLPSMEQLLAGSEQNYETQDRVLKEELKKSNEVIEKLSNIAEKLKKNQQLGWEDEKKLKQMADDQERMNRTLDELKEDISENISTLDENSIISEETMQKYMKLKELIDGIFPDDMKEKLKKLSEMSDAGKFDKNKYAELLSDFEQQQKQFGEELEKSIEILEQIKNEYMIERLIRQLDDMITRQNEVNSALSEANDAKKEVTKEEKIESSFSFFEKELDKLNKDSKELSVGEIMSELDKDGTKNDFAEMKKSLEKNDAKNAKNKGTEIASELLKTKKSLAELKDEMNEKQKKEMKKEIEKVISEVILVSERVEEVKNFSKDLSSGSSHSSEVLKKFSRAESSFNSVTEKIFAIAKRTFFINNLTIGQLGRISSLFGQMSEIIKNRQFSATYDRNNALMGGLNRLAVLLNDAKDEMDNSSSASGMDEMIKKMEEMARKQAELNSQTSSMQSGQGQMSMSQMQQMMNRLAMEQAQLYEALMKMQSKMQQPGKEGQPGDQGSPMDGMSGNIPGDNGKPGGSGSPKQGPGGEGGMAGNSGLGKKLGNAAESMKEAEKQLKDKKLTESLMANQNQALDKLLDAIESAKREKYENKRESSSGDKIAVDPGVLKIKNGQDLREMMLRSLKDGYTNKYKVKIKNYFKELEN
jgi:hypothetical protein